MDREQKATYDLTVTVTDQNGTGRSNSTRVIIDILDDNDNAPVFAKPLYTAFLFENSLKFIGHDDGSGFRIQVYTLSKPFENFGQFKIF